MAKRVKKSVVVPVAETSPQVETPQVVAETTPSEVVAEKVKDISEYQLVYFSASWCAPCKISKPVVEKACIDNKVDYKILVADVEENGKDIANKYNVRSVPTIIIFENGIEKTRHIGAINDPKIQELIKINIG